MQRMAASDPTPVGYHVFYAMLPHDLPDGKRIEAPLQGPMRDDKGALVRLPLGVDVKVLPLEAGRYQLVPVDSRDRRVDHVEPIEIVVPVPLTRLDPRVVVLEVIKRAVERIALRDDLAEVRQVALSDEMRALLRAHGQHHVESGDRFAAVMAATTPEETTVAVDALAADLEAVFVQLLRHGGSVPNDRAMPLTSAAVRALMKEPLRCSLQSIRASVERIDYADAAARVLARLHLGIELPASALVDLIPGIGHPLAVVAVARASGDVASAVIDSLRVHRRPDAPIDNSVRVCTLFAAWRVGDRSKHRDAIVACARSLARRQLIEQARALMCALAKELDDPHLTLIAERVVRVPDAQVSRASEQVEPWIEAPVERVIAGLPPGEVPQVARIAARNVSQHAPARAVPRILVPKVTRENVSSLSVYQLAAQPLPDNAELLQKLTRRFLLADQWERANACASHASSRGLQPCADLCHAAIVEYALQVGRLDVAAVHFARVVDSSNVSPGVQIAYAIASRDPGWIDLVTEHASEMLDGEVAEHVALALTGVVPPLGVLLARGCVDGDGSSVDQLIEAVERARDEAGLPPFDRAWHLRERLRGIRTEIEAEQRLRRAAELNAAQLRDEVSRLNEQLSLVRSRLLAENERASSQYDELESLRREHDMLRQDYERLGREHERCAALPIEPAERRTLRQRIEELEAIIREGNEERAGLRRALSERESAKTPAPSPAIDISPDSAEDGVTAPSPPRRALVAEASRTVREAMQNIPPHVAAEAMRTLGQLAAGDVLAWKGVKQAKGTTIPIYTARIGIHHRLIFRIGDGTLFAMELVTREDLLSTLKRMRSSLRTA